MPFNGTRSPKEAEEHKQVVQELLDAASQKAHELSDQWPADGFEHPSATGRRLVWVDDFEALQLEKLYLGDDGRIRVCIGELDDDESALGDMDTGLSA